MTITCAECGTLDTPDQTMARLCFWCAELQRLHPHGIGPELPNPMRPPERR